MEQEEAWWESCPLQLESGLHPGMKAERPKPPCIPPPHTTSRPLADLRPHFLSESLDQSHVCFLLS